MKTDRKPPLPRSPMKIRTRQALRPVNTPLQTPSGSTTKPQMKGRDARLENSTMTCDLKALAKMVQDELGVLSAKATPMNGNSTNSTNASMSSTCLFERGRLYEAYSARRNERLQKKKQSETTEIDEPKSAYNLGVKNDSTKKKKSVAVASYSSVDRTQHHRYSLRSTTKKPPLPPVLMDVDETTTTTTTVGKRGGSRTRRK